MDTAEEGLEPELLGKRFRLEEPAASRVLISGEPGGLARAPPAANLRSKHPSRPHGGCLVE